MGESDSKFFDVFPAWLRSLGEDTEQLGDMIGESNLPSASRHSITGALNYLFKSLDLIPDGIDDIGFLDDAFVLRVGADIACREDVSELNPDKLRNLNRLANDAESVREFLGKDYERLEAYVNGLRKGAARGRSVQDIVDDDKTREDFLSDVRGFAKSYEPPAFRREEKNLIKLKAFFDAKLPK